MTVVSRFKRVGDVETLIRNGLRSLGDPGMQLHSYDRRELMNALADRGRVWQLLWALKTLTQRRISCTDDDFVCLMTAWHLNGKTDRVIPTYRAMLDAGIKPTGSKFFARVIRLLVAPKDLVLIQKEMRVCKVGCDASILSALLHTSRKIADLLGCKRAFQGLRSLNSLRSGDYGNMLRAFAEHGEFDQLSTLLSECQTEKVPSTRGILNAKLELHARRNERHEFERTLQLFKSEHVKPGVTTFQIATRFRAANHDHQGVVRVYNFMLSSGIPPTREILHAMAQARLKLSKLSVRKGQSPRNFKSRIEKSVSSASESGHLVRSASLPRECSGMNQALAAFIDGICNASE